MRAFLQFSLVAMLMSGCAFQTGYVTLDYQPTEGVHKIAGAELVQVQVNVTDKREVKDKVGRKINGYGIETANLVSKTEVNKLVKDALAIELANRGFILNPAADTEVAIDVELNKFYNEFKLGFWSGKSIAETTLKVNIKNRHDHKAFLKIVVGKGLNPGVMAFTGKNAKISLELALKDAISQLVNDPEFIQSLTAGHSQALQADVVKVVDSSPEASQH